MIEEKVVKCDKCHAQAEFSHIIHTKGGTYEVYFCDEGHEVKIKVESQQQAGKHR